MILATAPPTPPDWLVASLWPVLVTQAVVGIIAAVGFFSVLRRFLTTEFPAAMSGVRDSLEDIRSEVTGIKDEFRKWQLDVVQLKERVDNLKFRQDLDETRSGSRRSTPR